jgi:hypothetical protein
MADKGVETTASGGEKSPPAKDLQNPEPQGAQVAPDEQTKKALQANREAFVEPADRSDPLRGEHEQQEGELLPDDEVTRRADKQRYEAQKSEPLEYPGDSGAQAKPSRR